MIVQTKNCSIRSSLHFLVFEYNAVFAIFNSTVKFIQLRLKECIIRKHVAHNTRYFIPINADTGGSINDGARMETRI